jgi:hypothetical protein
MSGGISLSSFSLTIGGITNELLFQQLAAREVKFNEYAHILFGHPTFLSEQESETVKVVKVCCSDLEVGEPSTFGDIVKKAEGIGLKLCPLHLAVFLRLEYLVQPAGPYLTVASAKLDADENFPRGFYLRNFDGALWLRGYCASDDYLWPLESEFVFVKAAGQL